MMPPIYATVDQVRLTVSKELLIEMTDDREVGQIDENVVELALVNAEGEINAALSAAGYSVPVTTPLPPGAEIVQTLAIWIGI